MSSPALQDSISLPVASSEGHDPRVSIVVPAHNAEHTLASCLDSLLGQDLSEPYEIIIVDDGSEDGTWQIAQEYSKLSSQAFSTEVIAITQPQRGAASARNLGVKMASSDIVLFTDADCEPVPGWARHLVCALRSGAAGAKGTYRTRQQGITAMFVQAEYESKYRRMRRLPQVDFIDTYSAAYMRSIFLEVGGFDEGLVAVEDQELSFRMAERGYRLVFVPEAIVYHTHAAGPAAYFRKKFWIGYWKVRVSALHPGRIISDSHTPQSIKVQMLLLVGGVASLFAAPFSRSARRCAIACAVAFLSTVAPFAFRLPSRNPRLALAAPFMMLLRAAGLSAGSLLGMGRFGQDLARSVSHTAIRRAIGVHSEHSQLNSIDT